MGYKIRVLLYDLLNMPKDRSCEARTLSTTDELYFSQPYLTPEEAAKIKSATVDHILSSFTSEENVDSEGFNNDKSEAALAGTHHSVEKTIHFQMATFFEKRRASGDARPCGPHTMAPLYLAVFGISKHELADEKFLGRLRRCGLETSNIQRSDKTPDKGHPNKEKKKKKKKQ